MLEKDPSFSAQLLLTRSCWLWTGPVNARGHGRLKRSGQWILPARYAWQLAFGAIPDDWRVIRMCAEPHCVRPEHHRVGTRLDSVRHALASYRARTGRVNQTAKVTPEIVLEIRRAHAAGATLRRLAEASGLTRAGVRAIVDRRTWIGIEPEPPAPNLDTRGRRAAH